MERTFDMYAVRDWRPEDATAVARYANNRRIWLNLRDAFPHPYTHRDAEAFIQGVMGMNPPTVFAIAHGDEAIGSIGLVPGRDVHRFTAELGYWLAEPFWGRGIATEAVRIVTAHALEELGMVRVFAEPYTTNPASARVLEKAGFLREGILRAAAFKDGRIMDQYLYAFVVRGKVEGENHL